MAINELSVINNQQLIDALSLRIKLGLGLNSQELRGLLCSSVVSSIKILTNENNTELGYVAWANVNKETAMQLLKYGVFPRYPCEWSEGKICLIVDVLFVTGKNKTAQKSLLDFLAKKRAIIFYRKNRTSLYIRGREKFKRHCIQFPIIANASRDEK